MTVAVAIDPSSPPLVGGSVVTLQTATFTPPAGSVLVAVIHANPKRTFSISNTVTTLTWSTIFQNQNPGTGGPSVSAFYTVAAGGATGMSVSATGSLNNDFGLKVYVVTGVDTATALGFTSTGNSESTDAIAKTVTPQVTNSMGFLVASDGAPLTGTGTTSPDSTFTAYDVVSNINGGSGYRVMGAAAGTETFTADSPGSTGTGHNWSWGVFEIRSAPVVASASSAVIHGTARFRASLW